MNEFAKGLFLRYSRGRYRSKSSTIFYLYAFMSSDSCKKWNWANSNKNGWIHQEKSQFPDSQ